MKYLPIISAILLTGCGDDRKTAAEKHGVEFLFYHEGCRVYGMHYALESHVFAKCDVGQTFNIPKGKFE